MNKLRRRLYEQYHRSYLRGNSLTEATVGPSIANRYVAEYECEFGALLHRVPADAAILDVGCGMGLLLYWLASTRPDRRRLFGVELSRAQLTLARRNLPSSVELVEQDGLRYLRHQEGKFGAIFCTDVLEHVESEDELLDLLEAARIALSDGGLFVCRVPNMGNLAGAHLRYIDMTHARAFTSGSLLQLLDGAGFSRAWIVPRRAATAGQWLRMRIEHAVHVAFFRLCGVGNERHFGRTIVGVAER